MADTRLKDRSLFDPEIVRPAVWESFRAGEIAAIRNYCEADCANTYLLYLRFQLMRCAFDAARYAEECALLRAALEKRAEPHWKEFLSLWKT